MSIQELIAMQQNGPRSIGFFGTRNMGFMHQELIEILSYAMVITVRAHTFMHVMSSLDSGFSMFIISYAWQDWLIVCIQLHIGDLLS